MLNQNKTQRWTQVTGRVSWSTGALLIANKGDPIVILRKLAIFFRSTDGDLSNHTKHGQRKITNLNCTANLGQTIRPHNNQQQQQKKKKTFKIVDFATPC